MTIDEGIQNLQTAIQKKQDYDDAMAYLNLLYRQKADTETSTVRPRCRSEAGRRLGR